MQIEVHFKCLVRKKLRKNDNDHLTEIFKETLDVEIKKYDENMMIKKGIKLCVPLC